MVKHQPHQPHQPPRVKHQPLLRTVPPDGVVYIWRYTPPPPGPPPSPPLKGALLQPPIPQVPSGASPKGMIINALAALKADPSCPLPLIIVRDRSRLKNDKRLTEVLLKCRELVENNLAFCVVDTNSFRAVMEVALPFSSLRCKPMAVPLLLEHEAVDYLRSMLPLTRAVGRWDGAAETSLAEYAVGLLGLYIINLWEFAYDCQELRTAEAVRAQLEAYCAQRNKEARIGLGVFLDRMVQLGKGRKVDGLELLMRVRSGPMDVDEAARHFRVPTPTLIKENCGWDVVDPPLLIDPATKEVSLSSVQVERAVAELLLIYDEQLRKEREEGA